MWGNRANVRVLGLSVECDGNSLRRDDGVNAEGWSGILRSRSEAATA